MVTANYWGRIEVSGLSVTRLRVTIGTARKGERRKEEGERRREGKERKKTGGFH